MNWIYAIIAAAVIGFGGGFYTKTQFAKAEIVTQVEKARTETASNITDSISESTRLFNRTAVTTAKVESVKKTVVANIQKQENAIRIAHNTAAQACSSSNPANANAARSVESTSPTVAGDGVYRLPISDVRLLNDARSDAPASAASSSDAESKTPSTVTASALAADSLDIVSLYRELAANHDTLVNYVQSIIDKQK